MILRRKPNSVEDYLTIDSRSGEERQWYAVYLPRRTDIVRFEFKRFANDFHSNQRNCDFAVDVDWADVVDIIGGLAKLARHAREGENYLGPRPDSKEFGLTETESAIIAAITALAEQIGINTTKKEDQGNSGRST